jgi:hypothetical protein
MDPIVRKVAAARGIAWVLEGLAAFRARPMPYLQLCLWLGLLVAMPVLSVFVALAIVFFQAGLVSGLRHGEAMRLSHLLDGFRAPGAFARLLPIAALKIAFAFVVLMVIGSAIGPALLDQMQATAQAGAPPAITPAQAAQIAPRLLGALLLIAPLAIVVNWVVLLAVPQAMLGGVPGLAAIGRALAAIWSNLGAMLANLALTIALLAGIGLLLAIPAAMLLAAAGAGVFAGLLQALLIIGLSALTFGLDGLVMAGAWRDLFAPRGDPADRGAGGPPPLVTQIEA